MKVTIAEHAGFCFGVERAIKIVREAADNCANVVTFGPIIHNPQVVEKLNEAGIRVAESVSDIKPGMTVIIRTHGTTVSLYEKISSEVDNVIDATCPFVKKVQNAAARLSDSNIPVVVVGEGDHPEVEGIVSHIKGEYYTVSSTADALNLPYRQKYGVVAQTTQNKVFFDEIVSIINNKCSDIEVAHTICSATYNRQDAALKLAKDVDTMLIVGGLNSANTTRLYHICREVCPRTYHIETEVDITDGMLADAMHVGISAGASTPNDLVYKIQEYILGKANMNSDGTRNDDIHMEDFESMLAESLKQPTRGSTVKGIITQIQGNDVIVNVGMKTEGVVDKSELPEDVKINDEVELMVVGFGGGAGYMQLSSRKNFNDRADWKDSIDKVVNVKIESHVEKGYKGKIGDLDAFIPENHIDLKSRMQEADKYIGQTLKAKVLKVSGSGKYRSALVSPKEYILEEGNKTRKEFLSQLNQDDVLKGTVKTLKEYGAFISFGSVDGFLHKSNITWGRPKNPSKYMEEGQEITVKIIEINRETGKIEVGLRQLTEDPWAAVNNKYPIDSSVSASVVGRRRNGFIAEIEPGVDAFIPLEELSWLKNGRVNINPKDVVEGRVLDYDNEHKRIIISVKMMSDNPWKTLKEETPEGSVVTATIKNITDFGIFVDFGSFIDGLIRKGDISWTDEPEDLTTVFNVGDKVEVKVLKIDEERERVSLGIKQLSNNPWRDMPKSGGAKGVEVTVVGAGKNGLEVELDNGLKGLIPMNELDPSSPSLDSYKAGDTLQATIIKSDQRERSVLLSIRKLIVDSERQEAKEYMKKLEKSDENQGFGNIFKDIFKNED